MQFNLINLVTLKTFLFHRNEKLLTMAFQAAHGLKRVFIPDTILPIHIVTIHCIQGNICTNIKVGKCVLSCISYYMYVKNYHNDNMEV